MQIWIAHTTQSCNILHNRLWFNQSIKDKRNCKINALHCIWHMKHISLMSIIIIIIQCCRDNKFIYNIHKMHMIKSTSVAYVCDLLIPDLICIISNCKLVLNSFDTDWVQWSWRCFNQFDKIHEQALKILIPKRKQRERKKRNVRKMKQELVLNDWMDKNKNLFLKQLHAIYSLDGVVSAT